MRVFAPTRVRGSGSFKLRLVVYFLLLALLPLGGALWAFAELAGRGETDRADARLGAALRVAVADYQDQLKDAEDTAKALASATAVQRAFATSNRAYLVGLSRDVPNAVFYSNGELLIAGSPPAGPAAQRSAAVKAAGNIVGRVVVTVPLDRRLVARLHARAGLVPGDRLALVSGGNVVAGGHELVGARVGESGRAKDVRVAGAEFRVLGSEIFGGTPRVSLVALTPTAKIDAAADALLRRVLAFAAFALACVGILAYILGRAIVRPLAELADAAGSLARGTFSSRVPVRGRDEFATLGRAFNDMASQLEARVEELAWERGRTRDAVSRFGEALAATHNPYLLLPVIVESMVEATGAAGGRLIVEGDELATAGDPNASANPLHIPLGEAEAGMIVLAPTEPGFTDEARELAQWLAAQAWTALENAQVHRRLEREAVTDGLTDLPNRRQFEESLASELGRVERFGGSLGLIFADLDDFKQVNDRYGHLAGDDILRAFADVLRETVREIDVPARYGGEEFAVLLPQTDAHGTELVAERIREAMASISVKTFPGAVLRVTASFGVATFPDVATQAALLAAADEALYRAKANGKNQVAVAGAPGRPQEAIAS